MKKAPNKKRETAACGSACLWAAAPPVSSRFFSLFLRRLRRLLFLPSPRFSLLLWAAAPPLLFASPLALLSGGCAALPLPLLLHFSSASSAAAPPHSPPLALVGGWRRPLAPLLHYSVPKTLPSQVINFFSFAIIA